MEGPRPTYFVKSLSFPHHSRQSRFLSFSPSLLPPSQATTGLFLDTGLLTAVLQVAAREPLKTQNTMCCAFAHTLSGLPTTHSKRSPASSRPSCLARSPSLRATPSPPRFAPFIDIPPGRHALPSGLRVLGSSLSFRSQLRCQLRREAFPHHLPEKSSSITHLICHCQRPYHNFKLSCLCCFAYVTPHTE